eukprot:gnl/MRDRNA2_/MRDRNA2_163770_c0_seq1.p1 gnl/MRDRNA2_/MRDRNA2_163770_c0~~gnl/MRDRNA2_/MRDRNA2_163770_c0_seq1.p1  ORF type:complete len:239 (+),score=32.35 gnl/MRDRNA2_/MRDRNA2_163770_c0_seq1:66-782(+)
MLLPIQNQGGCDAVPHERRGHFGGVDDLLQRLRRIPGMKLRIESWARPKKNNSQCTVNKDKLTLRGVRQFYIPPFSEDYKVSTIVELLEDVDCSSQSIIYCNANRTAESVADQLMAADFNFFGADNVAVLHSDLNGKQRDNVMNRFHSGSVEVLISTDVVPCDINMRRVSLVINYDLPEKLEEYVERVGHTKRFSCKKVGINFVNTSDVYTVEDIERYYHTQIDEMPRHSCCMIHEWL